jgi:peptidoglycan/xylan/chitin deacetylase (PgdA/CDA1 family)
VNRTLAPLPSHRTALLALFALASLATPALAAPGVSILCYHHIDDRELSGYSVKPAAFEEQMEYLAANGFHVLPLTEVVARLEGKDQSPFPEKAVAITFDDGYRCAHERALPVLRKHRFHSTWFLYPSFVGPKGDKLPWEVYKQLTSDPLVDLQSHSYTHPNFAKLARTLAPEAYAREMQKELAGSRKTLESRLGKTVDQLAWPFGVYDEQLQKCAAEAGYRAMYSVNGSANGPGCSPRSISRVMVMYADGPKAFARKAGGQALELEVASPRDGAILENGPYRVSARITDPEARLETVKGVSAGASGKVDPKTGVLTMSAPRAIKAGVHIVTVTAAGKSGGLRQATWLFRSK